MKKLKTIYKASDIVIGGLFLILPFFSMPLVLFQFFKTRRKFYSILISVFFALTASLLAPTGDLYRIYIIYFDFQQMNFDGFLSFLSVKPDFLFYFLLYIFSQTGLSVRIIIFILIFSFFQLSFNLLLKQKKQVSIFVALLFILQFDFLLQGLFLRFPMSMLVVIYAFLNKIEDKKPVLILLFLASMIHFAALITIPLYFLSRVKFKKLNLFLLISLFIMPFGSMILIFMTNHLLPYFPDTPLKTKIDSYFLGYWALEFFEERTWKALLQFYFERIFYILILCYFLLTKDANKYRKYVITFLILINVLFTFPNLFSRYSVLAIFFGLYCIVQERRSTQISHFIKVGLAVIIPMVFMIRIVAQQKNIRIGFIPNIVYSNFISLSLKTYDKDWILKNIDKETARPKAIKSL